MPLLEGLHALVCHAVLPCTPSTPAALLLLGVETIPDAAQLLPSPVREVALAKAAAADELALLRGQLASAHAALAAAQQVRWDLMGVRCRRHSEQIRSTCSYAAVSVG